MADGSTAPRGARFLSMDEICILLDVERRTVERWIAAGKFPTPSRISDNKVAVPLGDLQIWARRKDAGFAAEIDRLAHSPVTDLRPESLKKQAATAMTRHYGEKVDPANVVIGRRRPIKDEDVQRQAKNFVEALRSFGAGLTPAEQVMAAMVAFPVLREAVAGDRPDLPDVDEQAEALVELICDQLPTTPDA